MYCTPVAYRALYPALAGLREGTWGSINSCSSPRLRGLVLFSKSSPPCKPTVDNLLAPREHHAHLIRKAEGRRPVRLELDTS